MTGAELKRIRKALGYKVIAFGRVLGYQGTDKSVSVQIRRFELDMRPIPPTIAVSARNLKPEKTQ